MSAILCIVIDNADTMSVQSLTTRTHVFKRFFYKYRRENKRKSSQNRFCLFIWGPGRIFEAKYGQKSREAVPVKKQFYKISLP